jgi:nicotinate-nucleotide pyrophosphorylase (carboxylating)
MVRPLSEREDLKLLIIDSVILAIREDVGTGDITTDTVIPADLQAKAKIIAKENGIICGLAIAQLVFQSIDRNIQFTRKKKDGDRIKPGDIIAEISGPARGILTAERTALNFLQRLSGISTLTNKFVKAAGKTIILDTRKTSPGMRMLDKYAVKTGGGHNHRLGLFDAVLIKDNHIAVTGDLKGAVCSAKQKFKYVEVEAKTMEQVSLAMEAGASRILLDNMTPAQIKKAVKIIRKLSINTEIEISGGVNIKNIKAYAGAGADYISIGALTHSAPALDLSLKIVRK